MNAPISSHSGVPVNEQIYQSLELMFLQLTSRIRSYPFPSMLVGGYKLVKGRRDSSMGGVVAYWEAWWLNGNVPDCCPTVPGSNPVSPQPTADCNSPGGLPPGMALGCGRNSVRGNRGENYENEPLVRQKHIKKKKFIRQWCPGK